MAHGITDLKEALTLQVAASQELLLLLAAEHRCIVELDLTGLEAQVERKDGAFARLQVSISRCRQVMATLALELGLSGADRLSLLLAAVATPQREELQALQGKLLELGALLGKSATANKRLLQGALDMVNRSLGFFERALNRSTTYGEAGRMVGRAHRASILCREA